jgi:hypothetical protein
MDMEFILTATGLGYLKTGSNLLQRDLGGRAMDRPLYMASGGAALPHHIVAVLLWPVIRVVRGGAGITPLRTLAFCALEWAFMAMISAGLLFVAGLFSEELMMQALIVLGIYSLLLVSAILASPPEMPRLAFCGQQ